MTKQNSQRNANQLTYRNVQVKITDHFAERGKTLSQLLTELILQEAKRVSGTAE